MARAALELADLQWEVFYVMSTDEALAHADIAYTRERLGWLPRYRFKHLPPSAVMKERFGADHA